MKRVLLGDGGPRGRRCCFGRVALPPRTCRSRRSRAGRHGSPASSTSTPTVRRPRHARRDRGGRRARRTEVRRLHRPWRRHARAGSAGLSIGVLCIDAVEISTTGGHYIALDLPASPYPLGGEARDVVEDVQRLGGFGIAAHPDSPKADSLARLGRADRRASSSSTPTRAGACTSRAAGAAKLELTASAVRLSGRPRRNDRAAAAADRSDLGAVDDAGATPPRRRARRRDAHAKLGWRRRRSRRQPSSLPIPSYDASFRALSVHVRPERPLTGDAAADAAHDHARDSRRHVYVAVDGVGLAAAFEFTATQRAGTVARRATSFCRRRR